MAEINLLPRKEFEISFNGTVIKGQFNTWALKRFCDKNKLTLGQLQSKKPEDYTMNDIIELILCAVESKARKTETPFSYSDVEACEWIDELGGIYSEKLVAVFNHQASEIEVKSEDEKKN